MASEDDLKEFPDISHKLSAPKKLSAYEKEKQEKEAKRQREERENAEALREFEEEHAAGSDNQNRNRHFDPHFASGGYGNRHPRFGGPPNGPRSGPGSLGPLPGPPPPIGLKRKRELLQAHDTENARRDRGWFADDETKNDSQSRLTNDTSPDQASRATLKLSSLPPIITKEEVFDILEPHLEVFSVEIDRPRPTSVVRASTAIATLGTDVSSSTIDAAVSALRDKYLGCGYFLSISKHLSSTALRTHSYNGVTSSEEPFGAQKARDMSARPNLRNAPPPNPYENRFQTSAIPDMVVPVSTSIETRTLRVIHAIMQWLLSAPDRKKAATYEAGMMNSKCVMQDERFAWLYDSSSRAGVYYRYLLWLNANGNNRHEQDLAEEGERLFPDLPKFRWLAPQPRLRFTDLNSLADVMDHPDYDSEEEEDDDSVEKRRFNSGAKEVEDAILSDEIYHLTPVQQARFAWLLSRLPTTHALLPAADVAHITNFAIAHAPVGSSQIVDLLLLNVDMPLSSSYRSALESSASHVERVEGISSSRATAAQDSPHMDEDSARSQRRENDDLSAPKFVALLVINDILVNTATAGAKGAWKYRQLFEAGFIVRKTFERLGRLHKELDWGKMRAVQWKHKIVNLLDLWERQNLFKSEVHQELKSSFINQSVEGDERSRSDDGPGSEQAALRTTLFNNTSAGRFKKVDGDVSMSGLSPSPSTNLQAGSADHEMRDVHDRTEAQNGHSGDPMTGVESLVINQSGGAIGGVPNRSHADIQPRNTMSGGKKGISISMKPAKGNDSAAGSNTVAMEPRRRMRAEDMFADSDDD